LGSVERVARWVSVKPAKHRYIPEVGDIVVGRVKEVRCALGGSSPLKARSALNEAPMNCSPLSLLQIAAKRWLVDIGARQDASLPLSAVHLTGGDQRRRTLEDQLAMRGILAEGDLVGVSC
jgi:exosome complex component RRP4